MQISCNRATKLFKIQKRIFLNQRSNYLKKIKGSFEKTQIIIINYPFTIWSCCI